MKQRNQKSRERYYQLLLMVTTFAALALMVQNHLLSQSLDEKKEIGLGTTITTIQTTTTEQPNPLLEKLRKFPEIESYAEFPATVNLLTQEQLDELSEKQPVLYSGLKAPLYKIEFVREDGKTLLVLYDSEKNQVVKNFEITSMVLGK